MSNEKTDTGKYFPVRITGDFEPQLAALAVKFKRSKADTVRYCVSLVYEQEFPPQPTQKPN